MGAFLVKGESAMLVITYAIFLTVLLGLVYAILTRRKEGAQSQWPVERGGLPALPQKISGQAIRYIKWSLILLAILLILRVIIITVLPLRAVYSIAWGKLNLCQSSFLYLAIILIGLFIIYPKFKHDLWLQRFLGGIILIALPLLSGYLGALGPLSWSIKKEYLIFLSPFLLFFMLPFFVMIFLSLILKKKVKSLDDKNKKTLKNLILFPFEISVVNLILFLTPIQSIKYLSASLFPFVALTLGIPAVVNASLAPKRLLVLAYIGIAVANLFLLAGYINVINYGFVGE